ncbi:MAG: energy transducer TonB [Thiobacillaceae bacterium]
MKHSLPTRVDTTLLARAEAGQAVAVADAGGGSNEFANYADGNPEFVYPRAAARLGLEGTVLLEVEVKADGSPDAIRLKRSSGHQILDEDAMRQIASWRFKPATRRGHAHSARVLVPVSYRLVAKGRP